MKYQYLVADAASIIMFPISYEYSLEAVSKPIIVSNILCPTLLSMEAGITITLVLTF